MWEIEYDNDTGPSDGGFWQWWDVTDGNRSFRCDSEDDAEWLCTLLNTEQQVQPDNSPKMCEECGQYPADLPSNLCCGCDAYKEHLS